MSKLEIEKLTRLCRGLSQLLLSMIVAVGLWTYCMPISLANIPHSAMVRVLRKYKWFVLTPLDKVTYPSCTCCVCLVFRGW